MRGVVDLLAVGPPMGPTATATRYLPPARQTGIGGGAKGIVNSKLDASLTPTTFLENEKRISPIEIRTRLEKVPDEDARLFGLSPGSIRPEWMVLTIMWFGIGDIPSIVVGVISAVPIIFFYIS